MKIAVIASSYPRYEGDGTAPFVKSISEALAKIGNEVEVVAPYHPLVNENFKDIIKVHWFKYAPFNKFYIMGHANSLDSDVKLKKGVYFLLPLFIFFSFLKLYSVARKQKSDMIHIHWVIPNGLPALLVSKILKIPYSISLHGSDIYIANKNWLFKQTAQIIFKHSSFVSACSMDLYSNAKKLGAPNNTKLIPWGADPEIFFKFNKLKNEKFNFRSNNEQIILLCLGRLVHKKGFSNLIKAMPKILEKDRNIKLIIGGEGPIGFLLEDLVNTLQLNKFVTFIGKVNWDEVVLFLNSGDIFIQPSIKDEFGNVDGLPTVILEAMACGLPIVSSDIGGVNMVIKNGENGRIVTPGNIEELAEVIHEIVQDKDLLDKMGKYSRTLVENQFNWDMIAKKLVSNF